MDKISNGNFSNPAIRDSVDFYVNAVSERTKGPQLEGLDGAWVEAALQDVSTRTVNIVNENGTEVKWPLLTAIKHDENYNGDFFKRQFEGREILSLSLPPLAYLDALTQSGQLNTVMDSISSDAVIAVSYQNDGQPGSNEELLLREMAAAKNKTLQDVTPNSSAFGQEYGLPSVNHYMSIVRVADRDKSFTDDRKGSMTHAFADLVERGEAESLPLNGPTMLLSEDLRRDDGKLFEQLWQMYKGQFDELVEDHPSLQMQPREELWNMLIDERSANFAHMEDGAPVSLCYFVDPKACVWLNPAYYDTLEKSNPEIKPLYFPGIVVERSRARQGNQYVSQTIRLMASVVERAGADLNIIFQTTNVSETYIPSIVTHTVAKDGRMRFDNPVDENGSAFDKIAQYDYRLFSVV